MRMLTPWLWQTLAGSAALLVTLYFLFQGEQQEETISVAFIGNSFMFANDLPRVLETFSEGKMDQDSMLHGSLNFKSLLRKGNGMYQWWGNSTNAINEDGMRDFGACTVNQLLLGYDNNLENFGEYYDDDGYTNPCFVDQEYLQYSVMVREPEVHDDDYADSSGVLRWDFVVMNDQSMTPTNKNKKLQSASVLRSTYVPLFEETGSTPVLFMTWGYWRDGIDMSSLVDVPFFTSQLWEGYQYYAQILDDALPNKARVAPVGLAFLLIWEENPSFWQSLFGEDKYHPSPHGTYLAACVIYCTIYNHLPSASTRYAASVFSRSRGMQISGDPQPLPTEEEAIYLRYIAKKVALDGYVPKSLYVPGG